MFSAEVGPHAPLTIFSVAFSGPTLLQPPPPPNPMTCNLFFCLHMFCSGALDPKNEDPTPNNCVSRPLTQISITEKALPHMANNKKKIGEAQRGAPCPRRQPKDHTTANPSLFLVRGQGMSARETHIFIHPTTN